MTFSSELDWGSYIISIAKTSSKKIGALIRSVKFLSPGLGLYLCKFTKRSCMEYCCHAWAGASSCYLELFDKLQKQLCRAVGPLLTSLEPLAHRRNVGITLVDAHLNWFNWFPFSGGRSPRYSDRLHDFSTTILRCYRDVYVNSFFPRTARSYNFLPIECFALTYDLNGF